jgi:hypothetical protein
LPPVRFRNDLTSVLDNAERITETEIRVGEYAEDPNFGHLLTLSEIGKSTAEIGCIPGIAESRLAQSGVEDAEALAVPGHALVFWRGEHWRHQLLGRVDVALLDVCVSSVNVDENFIRNEALIGQRGLKKLYSNQRFLRGDSRAHSALDQFGGLLDDESDEDELG